MVDTAAHDCPDFRDSLALFVGGDLSPDERASMRQHLQRCPTCRVEFGALLRPNRALRTLRTPTDGFDQAFFQDLGRRIDARLDAQPPPEWLREASPRRRPWRWVSSAAAAAVLVAIGIAFSRPASPLLSRDPIRSAPAEPHRDALTIPVRQQGLFGRIGVLEQIESDVTGEQQDELHKELVAVEPDKRK